MSRHQRDQSRPIAPCGGSCVSCVRRLGASHLLVHLNLALVKAVLGVMGGSKAVAVSAMYSLRDCTSAAMVWLGARPANDRQRSKLTVLVAASMSLLILLSVAVLCSAILHSLLQHAQRPPAAIGIWISLGSSLACLLMARQASCAAAHGHHPALATHVAYSRDHAVAAAMVAVAVFVARNGPVLVDAIASTLEATAVLWYAARILRRSVHGLLDGAVAPARARRIEAVVLQVAGGASLRELRATCSGDSMRVAVSMTLSGSTTVAAAERIRTSIEAALRRDFAETLEVLVDFCPSPDPPACPSPAPTAAIERA